MFDKVEKGFVWHFIRIYCDETCCKNISHFVIHIYNYLHFIIFSYFIQSLFALFILGLLVSALLSSHFRGNGQKHCYNSKDEDSNPNTNSANKRQLLRTEIIHLTCYSLQMNVDDGLFKTGKVHSKSENWSIKKNYLEKMRTV